MPVDRTDVVEPEGTEERRRVGRDGPTRIDRGEPRNRRRVAAPIVVQHDHRVAPAEPEVVERFVGEATGERAVADDRDDLAAVAGGVSGDRQPEGVAHRGRGVAVLDDVVLGFDPGRVPRHPAALAEPAEPVEPARDQLVDVALVPGVPHDGVAGRVEDAVQRQGQLDRAEVGPEVASVDRHRLDERFRSVDCFEQGVHHRDRASAVIVPGSPRKFPSATGPRPAPVGRREPEPTPPGARPAPESARQPERRSRPRGEPGGRCGPPRPRGA